MAKEGKSRKGKSGQKNCERYKVGKRRDVNKSRRILRERRKAARRGNVYTAPGWNVSGDRAVRA